MFDRILVICTGNICRSPMAEALLRERLPGRQVSSAGIGALVGHAADPHAIRVLREAADIDLSSHVARQVNAAMLADSDLVLVMDRTHADWLNRRYPEHRGRVHKLLRWQTDADVADPYRQDLAAFEQAYAAIADGVDEWCKRI